MISTTSSGYGRRTTAERLDAPVVTCEFVMPGCQHGKIFNEEYLRTNRTSHTKIMRCFPHCCPGHRPRSYCGASIHVKIQSTSPETDHQLVVFGRFRPVHLSPLQIGDRVSASAIHASLQRVDPSNGEWIESRVSRHETEPLLFVITPHDHWYYPWSGAATVAMRGIHHAFEAVVFSRVSMTELEVVAKTSSPQFKLKSYRRNGPKPAIEDDGSESSQRVSPKRKATTRAPSPTEDLAASWKRQSLSLGPNDASATGIVHVAYPQSHLRGRPASAEASPPTGAQAAATMDMLMTWLHELPASSAGSRLLLSWQQTVLQACEAHRTAPQQISSVRAGLVPILSALDVVDAPVAAQMRPSSSPFTPSSPLDTIDAAVRVLLNEWFDLDAVRASKSSVVRVVLRGFHLGRGGLTVAHSEWLSTVATRAQRFVDRHTRSSWSQVATAAMESHTEPSSIMDESEFSYRAFVARYRERLLNQYGSSGNDERLSKRQRIPYSERKAIPDGLRHSARVWAGQMEDMAIEMAGMDQHALSLLAVIQFWKLLSCLRLDFLSAERASDSPAQLSVASVFNTLVRDGSFTKLTLDGQYRWFNCLPSGEPTIGTTLMGYVVGDYVGRATSADTIHITTYLWPATAESSTAFAWHWTIDAASFSTGSGSSSSVMSVVVESASVDRSPHAMETMSMAEKLRCVGRWQHACELRLVYNAQ